MGPFCPNLGKYEFSWKKRALLVFKYSNYLPLRQKSEKLIAIPEKNAKGTDRQQ